MNNNEILLTPAALLDFLRQIDELADKDISVNDTGSALNITIGDSSYSIDFSQAEEVEVPNEVVDEVAEINENTYEEIDDVEYTEVSDEEEVIEGSSRSGYSFGGASFYNKIPDDLCRRVKNIDNADVEDKQSIILDFCNYVIANSDSKAMCDEAEKLSDMLYYTKPEDKDYVSIISDADDDFSEFLDKWEFGNYIWDEWEDSSEVVEGGIIKEVLKTLAVGGMVRLAGKVLGDDFKGK